MPAYKVECPATPAIDSLVDLADRAIRQPKNAEQRGSGTPLTPRDSELQRVAIDFASASLQAVIPGNPGQEIHIYELFLYQPTAQDLTLFDGALKLAGTLTNFPGQSGVYLNYCGEPHFELHDGSAFGIQSGGANQVSGFVVYRTRTT